MRRILLLAAILVPALVFWALERAHARSLETQLRLFKPAEAELSAACSEQQRLRQAMPSDDELRALQTAASEAHRLQQEQAERAARPAPGLATTAIGEWSAASGWRDRGTTTPRAALETALWSAAGGDTARFAELIELPDDARGLAEALVAKLPAAEREKYPTAEALVAAFTIKRIPVGPAQVVWAQESEPDAATLCVFVRDPSVPLPSPAPAADNVDPPPMTREQAIAMAVAQANQRTEERSRPGYVPPAPQPQHTTLAYLSLRRREAGWRLQVPSTAVESIAQQLSGGR
jgi:hypothetical protein